MAFATDYRAVWSLDRDEEHAASREAARYLAYRLDGGGGIRFQYERAAVPHQFRLRVSGDERVRDTLEERLHVDLEPTWTRRVLDTIFS